jgi:hypothetical protein
MPIYGTAADHCSEVFAFGGLQTLASNARIEEKDFLSALPKFNDLASKLFDAIKNMREKDQNEYLVPLKKDANSKQTILTNTTPETYQNTIKEAFQSPSSGIAFMDNADLGLVFYKGNFYFSSWFQQNILHGRWRDFREDKPRFDIFQKTIPWFRWNAKNNSYQFQTEGGRAQLLNDLLENNESLTLYRGMSKKEYIMFSSQFSTLETDQQRILINKIQGGTMMGLFYTNSLEEAKSFGGDDNVVVSINLTRDELLKYAEKDAIYLGFEGDPSYLEINLSDEDFIRSLAAEKRYRLVE